MSSNAVTKPSYAAMAKRHPSTPKTKRSSSKLTPSIREKSEKRSATNSTLKNRKINRGSDEVSKKTNKLLPSKTPDQPSVIELWNSKQATSVTPSPDKNPPSIKRTPDGWHFDPDIFDDEVESDKKDEKDQKKETNVTDDPNAKSEEESKTEGNEVKKHDVQDQEGKNAKHNVSNQIINSASDTVKKIINSSDNDNLSNSDDGNHYKHLSDNDDNDDEEEEYDGYIVDEEDGEPGEDNEDTLSDVAVKPPEPSNHEKKDDKKKYDVDSINGNDLDEIIQKEKINDDNKNKEQSNNRKKIKKKENNNNKKEVIELLGDTTSTTNHDDDDDDDDDDVWEDMDEDDMDEDDNGNVHEPNDDNKKEIEEGEDDPKADKTQEMKQKETSEMEIDENEKLEDPKQKKDNSNDQDQDKKDDDNASTVTEKAGTIKWGPKGPPPPHKPDPRQQSSTSHQINGKNHKPTKQDDINSVNSDETTHNMSKEEADAVIAPKNTRFQLSITVLSEDAAKVAAMMTNGNNKEAPTVGTQLIEGIKACIKELKATDDESYLLSWRDTKNLEHMALDDDFPITSSEITKFFDGYRSTTKNKNKQFRHTIKIRLAHTKPLQHILPNMTEWARSNGMTFKPTIIQAEHPTQIGWLVYSSSFTDQEKLKQTLRKVLDIEWGFRIQEVTKSESGLDFRKKTKALFIFVDKKHEGAALKTVQHLFVNEGEFNPIRDFKSTYSYFPNEGKIRSQEKIVQFKLTLARQKVHSASIRGQFVTIFEGDIDDPIFDHPDCKNKVSLRQLIMAIPSKTAMEAEKEFLEEGEEPMFQPLFHSVDFTLDSKEIWLDGYPGPGGSGFVISFYVENYAEAIEMINGLGVYLATVYEQHQKFSDALSIDHWQSNEGWTWVVEENKFITKESIVILENILSDSNMAIRRKADAMFAQELQEEQEKLKKKNEEEKKDKDKKKVDKKKKEMEKMVAKKYSDARKELNRTKKSDLAAINKNELSKKIIARKKFQLKRKQFKNDDAVGVADIEDLTRDTPQKPIASNTIEIDNDAASATSSITANSFIADQSLQDVHMEDANQKDDDNSVTASIRTFNNMTIEQIFEDPTKTPEEKKTIAENYCNHLVKKQLLKGQQMIEKRFGKEKEAQSSLENDKGKSEQKPASKSARKAPKKSQNQKERTLVQDTLPISALKKPTKIGRRLRRMTKAAKARPGGRKSTGSKG